MNPTKGLITNSEEWYDVRSQVQQDMMRPKSALYYISHLEKIALDVTGALDIVEICQEYDRTTPDHGANTRDADTSPNTDSLPGCVWVRDLPSWTC